MNTSTTFPSVRIGRACVIGVPGLHNRLVSAKAALAAAGETSPDVIAVELPRFMIPACLQAIGELYPIPAAVTIPLAPGSLLAAVLTPVDSITQAMRWGLERGIPIRGVDLHTPQRGAERPALRLDGWDDWSLDGKNLLEGLQRIGPAVGLQRQPVDDLREVFMAHRLRELAGRGFERILWVGGAAHWDALVAQLQRDPPNVPPDDLLREDEAASIKATIAIPDAATLLGQFLDDIPQLAHQFSSLAPDAAARFDKWAAIDRLIAIACERHRTAYGPGPSARAMKQFRALLMKILAGAAAPRLVPRLCHLFAAAEAAVSNEFAVDLLDAAMEFPLPSPTSVDGPGRRYPMLKMDQPEGVESYHGRTVSLKDAADARFGRAAGDILDRHSWDPRMPRGGGLETYHPTDLLTSEFLDAARAIAARQIRHRLVPAPFKSSPGKGVHLRATLLAMARRSLEDLHIRMPRRHEVAGPVIDPWEPVVLDLAEPRAGDGHAFSHVYADGDLCPSILWTSRRSISSQRIVYSHSPLSVHFVPPHWSTRQYRQMRQREPGRIPLLADILAEFRLVSPAQARSAFGCCAVRHARRAVVWMGESHRPVPAAVLEAAAQRGIEIARVDVKQLPADQLIYALNRYAWWCPGPEQETLYVAPPEIANQIEAACRRGEGRFAPTRPPGSA